MMAGLGLSNALDSYQEGVAWKQQQDETTRVLKQRAAIDEANKAATDAVGASQAEWAATGAQGQYKPNVMTMMGAAEARGKVLAKHGLWDQFMQNEAAIAPLKIKARSDALQQYQMDGDPIALARSVYPTIFDGKNITGIEKIEGADGSERLGLKPIASKLKMKFSDGTEGSIDPQQLVGLVKQSLIDPQVTAKNEIMLNLERAKADIEAGKQIRIGAAKGEQDRKTEDVKAGHQLGLAGAKFGYDKQLHEIDAASHERIGLGNNAATLGAANIAADSRRDVAETNAAARPAATDATIKNLREERLAAKGLLDVLAKQLENSNSKERPAVQKKILDATANYEALSRKISSLTGEAPSTSGQGLGDAVPRAPAASASRPPLSAFNR